MDQLEFLLAEYHNVERALGETLRYDYRPEQSLDFFNECKSRLLNIKLRIDKLTAADVAVIASTFAELNYISNWICYIERSHLGEFSWPFAEVLKRMADVLLSETDIFGAVFRPIINIISEGAGYRITYETPTVAPSSQRRFAFVVFPRSLKRHVLLHTLFAHELCHTAFYATDAGQVLNDILSDLTSKGPLSSVDDLNLWLRSPSAPTEVLNDLADFRKRNGADFTLSSDDYSSWKAEFLSDLFGLVLFGPSFMPAHKLIISSSQSKGYRLSRSHPLFESRYKMLVSVMRVLNWDCCTMRTEDGPFYTAESAYLSKLMTDPYPVWANFFDDDQLLLATTKLRAFFSKTPRLSYERPSSELTYSLLSRLIERTPPIYEVFDEDNHPRFHATHIGQTMYCGWLYFISRNELSQEPLDFFQVNQLCDQALLQQAAIDIVKFG